MRCKNCGWQNPDGLSNCERCSSPLESGGSSIGMEVPQRDLQSESVSSPLRSTVREAAIGAWHDTALLQTGAEERQIDVDGNGDICNNCGYSLSPRMNVCPQCGTSRRQFSTVRSENRVRGKEKHCSKCGGIIMPGEQFCPTCGQKLRNSGTVNAWDNPQNGDFCSLRPIPWSRENTEYNAISFSGERIVLNRANTDPNNQSITSQEQAVLTHDGKDWYIEDLSEQHSTMLRVSRKTKLQSGDVIALGNRLFEFKD